MADNVWSARKPKEVWRAAFPQHECGWPALHTVGEMVRTNVWWLEVVPTKPYADAYFGEAGCGYEPGDIDPALSLIIGDTEPDVMIALDYRVSQDRPRVLVMDSEASRWLRAFEDIEALMKAMQLRE